jgi:RimJ/RimL family protein N-acetyltransferase
MNTRPYEGRLVRLRARDSEDAVAFHSWFNDWQVTNWMGVRYPVARGREAWFVEHTPEPGFTRAAFAVEALADGRLVGNCELQCELEDRTGTVGIAMGERNAGFGTDTMRTLCRVGFEVMNLHRIGLTVDASNERARHVYRKVGFKEEGELRDHRFIRGQYRGTVVMGLFRAELKREETQ